MVKRLSVLLVTWANFLLFVCPQEDFKLVREGPSERRKWLDIVLASASQNYFQVLQSFHRAMKERDYIKE